MAIDYRLSKLTIMGFRGIDDLELEMRQGFPTVLIGSNNAGKSTILNAIALALNGGGFHQFTPSETDFHCGQDGVRCREFLIQVHFASDQELGFPAVRGVGKPTLIHGVEVRGKIGRDGKMSHRRRLLDAEGKAVTIAPRTALSPADKVTYADHDVGHTQVNARWDDIREHTPDIWLFKPQNIAASLYFWKTGPIAKLSRLLAERFLKDKWDMPMGEGKPTRPMPETLRRGHEFFQDAIAQFPFWAGDMKPHLEKVIGRYVGLQAKIDLKPDVQAFEEWIAQQLAVSLATDPEGAPTPLQSMGDGWQAVVRLAALEALTKYPELTKERVVLLVEEPETHLHPHLRRKVRKILGQLSAKGWTVIYTTHSAEMISFDEDQAITRLVRAGGTIKRGTVFTDRVESGAKLQSKLDSHGAHDFLFGTAAVFCEGRSDDFALSLGLDKLAVDIDGRSVSVTQCGSVTAIPAFVQIATDLGIRWCAVSDEDRLHDGSTKPITQRARASIARFATASDVQAQWSCDLERCLNVTHGKAEPELVAECLSDPEWQKKYPDYLACLRTVAGWIDPTLAA